MKRDQYTEHVPKIINRKFQMEGKEWAISDDGWIIKKYPAPGGGRWAIVCPSERTSAGWHTLKQALHRAHGEMVS